MNHRPTFLRPIACLTAVALLSGVAAFAGGPMKVSKPFSGVKVNGGTVAYTMNEGQHVLTLSDDFKTPDTPAPHWQVVDSKGNVFLLQRLLIKGDRFHKSIALPSYVVDVAKVQIWCAFAETLLGETSFDAVLKLADVAPCAVATSQPFKGPKANVGTVAVGRLDGQLTLTLSDDFVVPDTPAPHWQVVDTEGRTFMLQRLAVKDGKLNKTIGVPAYVKSLAKIQIWCAFAETVLGEAVLTEPVTN